MNRGDGGLARHVLTFREKIDWEKGKIIGRDK